jgi:hypothetical protein
MTTADTAYDMERQEGASRNDTQRKISNMEYIHNRKDLNINQKTIRETSCMCSPKKIVLYHSFKHQYQEKMTQTFLKFF